MRRVYIAGGGVWLRAALAGAALWGGGIGALAETNAAILFNRDIRPILSQRCFPCHGFDARARKADLRLDTPEGATSVRDGRQAIKGGDLAQSELWRRINSPDPKVVMPPPESGKPLKPDQVALVRQWLLEGAAYQKHWAFEPPARVEPPAVAHTNWVRNEIDRFIVGALEARKLAPAAEAPKETLIRRVTLDLTGLPPSLAEVDAFLADERPDAYERVVDRLLASPRYGEQMARHWLDVARYGDTHGLHLDNERSLWPYRDWVVQAFNQDLPFDQFTIWQLAGDLLPEPTRDQLVASGFNRCNVSTSEGGAIDEEFQVRYAVDRVETTSTTWLGLTMGCAVCHDHKFDPISQKEFYEMFSIFNNIAEKAMDGNALLPPPTLQLPSPEQQQQRETLDRQLQELEAQARSKLAGLEYVDPTTLTNPPKPEPKEIVWIEDDFPPGADPAVNGGNETNRWVEKADGPVYSGQRAIRRAGKGLHQVFFRKCEQPLTINRGDKLFAHVYLEPADPPKAVMLQFHSDEWRYRANWGDAEAIPYGATEPGAKIQAGPLPEAGRWVRLEVDVEKLGVPPGTQITGLAFTVFDGTSHWDQAGQVALADPARDPTLSFVAWEEFERKQADRSAAPPEIKDLLKQEREKLDDAGRQKLRDHFLISVYAAPDWPLLPLRAEMKSVREKREALEKEIPATMISKELEKPRPAWVLIRGQYDKHGETVGPGVPSVLPPLPPGEVTNRLTLARWLVEPGHPLTARVTVNRLWQQFFGTGLVKTAEDFGAQGEWPSHPELLDWLATEFPRRGWDVKGLVRLLVTSATYRQQSRVRPELAELDPENRWLGRGPRYRLDAEELRDNALAIGGLLNLKMGGRGVRTYQPPGIWEAVGYTTSNTAKYTQDHGDDLYRRSLYLFWKRTAPPPSMTTLDAPSREKCWARRERTDTPLQALLMMNDIQYFESARHLAGRMWREGGADDGSRLRYGFRLATARQPTEKECSVLRETLAQQRARYSADAEAARKVISVGESPLPEDIPPAELAAYTLMANLLLNLDEVITKN